MEAEMTYLLEEQARKLENAEMLIERLNRSVERGKCLFLAEHGRSERLRCALKNFIKAYYRGLIGAVPDMPPASIFLDNPPPSPIAVRNLLEEMVREAETALRTAEESSVVDGTPAKQSPNAENADGDGDSLNDIETSLRAKTEVMKRLLESQTLSPELAALGRELVRLAEKSLGEVEE